MGRLVRACLILVVVSSYAASARAEPGHFSLYVAGDTWVHPSLGGFGIALIRYDLPRVANRFDLTLELNTDTLRIAVDNFQAGGASFGAEVRGEAVQAGLSRSYLRDGHGDARREYLLSYLYARGYMKVSRSRHYLELAALVRGWFANKQPGTAKEFILPPQNAVGELRAYYTFWSLADDPSLREAHRLYRRLRGFAFGVEFGTNIDSNPRPWGATDPLAFSPLDLRNHPDRLQWELRQWFMGGVRIGSRVRLQLEEVVMWSDGIDDRYRARLGGQNPYVEAIPGQPWAAYVDGKYMAVRGSIHGAVYIRGERDIEVGLLAAAAIVQDGERVGASFSPRGLYGFSAFLDARIKTYQLDLRLGYSPRVRDAYSSGGVGIYAGFGTSWGGGKK